MKTLTIIRHAKSDWSSLTASDHDRSLNKRGERDAPRMGQFLQKRGVSSEIVLSSTALRAITTARIISEEIGIAPESIVEMSELYLASGPTLLRIVNQIDEELESAMIFGHNPGLHDLACGLLGNYDAIEHFPTCSVARLKINTATWGEIEPGDAELEEHLFPKMLPPVS